VTDHLGGRLRRLISNPAQPLLLPGAPNALTARIIEDSGFGAVYLSGAGITNSFLGAPDIGLLTLTELAQHVAAARDAVSLPLVVDADTGFGNAINTGRTVRELARAGADAIQLEDQTAPKRCGHFAGKGVITTEEMLGKLHAALDARPHDDVLIIARTDARAELGLDEACDRASAYRDAGADAVFVEAPTDATELRAIGERLDAPLVANMVEGGITPLLSSRELATLGFTVHLYANAAMRAGMAAMARVLGQLRDTGTTEGVLDEMASWAERQRLVRKPDFDELDTKYGQA
jgi:2,3-dimethylmalate lyase